MPKTQEEYIATLAPESRSLAERLRAAIHRAAPEATDAIKYGIPAFLIDGSPFVYFAVWKKHIGLYPIYQAPPDLEARIAPYRHGKDTVRFSLTSPIDYELVALLVRFKREHALAKPTAATKPRRSTPKANERRKATKS